MTLSQISGDEEEFCRLIRRARPPVLFLGAGASWPHLPVSKDLKEAILREARRRAKIGGDEFDRAKERLNDAHATLEVVCSLLRYRCPEAYHPERMWEAIARGSPPNALATLLAAGRAKGLIGPVLTTNFDDMITNVLDATGLPITVKTREQMRIEGQDAPKDSDLVPLHGTVIHPRFLRAGRGRRFTPPTSATVRGWATPLSPETTQYLRRLIGQDRALIFIGYSGNDMFDLVPFFRMNRPSRDSVLVFARSEKSASQLGPLFREEGGKDYLYRVEVAAPERQQALIGTYVDTQPPQESPDESDWETRLNVGLFVSQPPSEAIRAFLADLHHNLHGAWVVCEHYYLVSVGYDEAEALWLGGVGGNVPSSLKFHGVDFGLLLLAQAAYREEQRKYNGLPPAERVEFEFAKASDLLGRFLGAAEAALPRVLAEGALPSEHAAMLHIGRAMALDYQGLVRLKRVQAFEAMGEFRLSYNAVGDATVSHSLGEGEAARLARERRAAIALFEACEDAARAAERLVGSAHGSGDLIPYRIWQVIAQENGARAQALPERISALERVLAQRNTFIEAEEPRADGAPGDYLMAHLPQYWLRASEVVKARLGVVADDAPPTVSFHELPRDAQASVERALEEAQRVYNQFKDLSSLPNSRFAPYHDALLVYHLSRKDLDGARAALDSAGREHAACDPRVQRKTFHFLNNMAARLDTAQTTCDSPPGGTA